MPPLNLYLNIVLGGSAAMSLLRLVPYTESVSFFMRGDYELRATSQGNTVIHFTESARHGSVSGHAVHG